MYRRFGKRVFDLAITIPATLLALPILLIVASLVRILLGKPVLFRQVRPGLGGRPFTVFKFRTMTDAKGSDGKLLPDADRLTAFGRFLRASSLDELPDLINVLSGEMSLVGPRPLLMQYLGRYSADQARRHLARPGITGWAQVNGRNAVEWARKFELDVWYVDHVSFALDLKILLMTVVLVFQCKGITQQGHATATEFMGSEKQ